MLAEQLLGAFDIFERNRLAAAHVVGDGDHAERNVVRAFRLDQPFEPGEVDVSLEPLVRIKIAAFRRQQIHGPRADIFDIGSRRVEVAVVGNHVPGLQARRGQDALGGSPLMGRENMFEAGDLADGFFEATPRNAARVAFVAEHQRGPLSVRHRARAAVGQKVDGDVFGVQQEDIVVRRGERGFAMTARRNWQWLGHLDAKRLDDRMHGGPLCVKIGSALAASSRSRPLRQSAFPRAPAHA